MPSLKVARTTARRAVPGLALVEVGRLTRRHWTDQLSRAQRRQAVNLLRTSKGWPGNLNKRQRRQAVELVRTFEPVAYGRAVALTFAGRKVGKKLKRG